MSELKIDLDPDLESLLDQVGQNSGQTREEIVTEALRRQLSLQLFERLRSEISAAAGAHGYFTDEDVFRDVS